MSKKTVLQSFLWRILVLFVLGATVAVNALANIVPFNGKNTGQVADQYDIYFFPAGYVFTIWSVIYIALFAYAIYQLLPAQRKNATLSAIAPLFIVNGIINSAWIVAWHYDAVFVSLLLMLGLLATLIAIYLKLDTKHPSKTESEELFIRFPFRLYLGWISVATIANAAVVLYVYEWNAFGWSDPAWAAIMMVVATLLTCIMLIRFRDITFAGVVIWAFLGIMVRFPNELIIQFTAGITSSLMIGMMIAGLYFHLKKKLPSLEHPFQK